MVTIFKNIFSKEPHYVTVQQALDRIKKGRSAQQVFEIREAMDKEQANSLKSNLPSVCFSGKFETRTDAGLVEHSGFICLDFDNVNNLDQRKSELIKSDFVYACWVSPSGNGLKALVKIAEPKKHREHFESLLETWSDLDRSGINVSRVCYESYDPDIYINENSKQYTKFKTIKQFTETNKVSDSVDVFQNILKWLSNKGNAFVTGERNVFMFKLASACNRFGMSEHDCYLLSRQNLSTGDRSFSDNEMKRTIEGAYNRGKGEYGTAEFTNEKLINKVTRDEVKIENVTHDIYDLSVKPKDVIFGIDVKADALRLYDSGFDQVQSVGIPEIDTHFKMKRGEISLLTGIGNYGKSSFLKWYTVLRVIKFKEKFAFFSPEDNPAQEFYHDLVEIYLGANCGPDNTYRPDRDTYEKTYDIISKSIFYIYPKDLAPTPEYIKERFLELCIKEKIDGCIIDPFNQMANDYGKSGRTDKYLETFLSDCSRFAQANNVYFMIVAHPKQLKKEKGDMNYPEPDVFDIADGAMWNNKLDNILVYHRPNRGTDPNSPLCTLSSKKIRRQKIVGKLGTVNFELSRTTRRFYFNGRDYLGLALSEPEPVWKTHTANTEISDMRKHKSRDFDIEFNNDPIEGLPF